jgi:4-aminobutyrate aminotransferase-like enzyme
VPAGNNVVRFLPPLIITDAHISEALTILETALDAISA